MNIWDIKDTVSNPWIRELYDDITVIEAEGFKVCVVEGEKLLETDKKYPDTINEEFLQSCKNQLMKSGEHFMTVKHQGNLMNIQLTKVNRKEYFICFQMGLEHIQEL